MFPVQFVFMLSKCSGDVAITLKFDVEKLGRIEPWPGFIWRSVAAYGLCHDFAHHSRGVPDLLDIFSSFERQCSFDTITNGVNIGYIRFEVCIDEHAAVNGDAGIVQPRHVRLYPYGNANEIARDVFPFTCLDAGHLATVSCAYSR